MGQDNLDWLVESDLGLCAVFDHGTHDVLVRGQAKHLVDFVQVCADHSQHLLYAFDSALWQYKDHIGLFPLKTSTARAEVFAKVPVVAEDGLLRLKYEAEVCFFVWVASQTFVFQSMTEEAKCLLSLSEESG